MESSLNDHISTENLHREMQLRRENESSLEVPEVGQESSEKVTKSPEPIQLSGSLLNENPKEEESETSQPGLAPESFEVSDDAGIDPTRMPDWQVVKPTELPDEPEPGQHYNDRFWDERSLAQKENDKDLQSKMLENEKKSFDRAAERGEDFSRPNSNEVLDPYYQSGSDPSEPPSAGHSLDSFI